LSEKKRTPGDNKGEKIGVRFYFLGHFPKDMAHGGIGPPEVGGDFFLPAAMFEIRGAHSAVAKGLAGKVGV
jgi:hypothetical protein